MSTVALEKEKKSMLGINILSVVIPVVVALMLGIRTKIDLGAWTKTLPHVIGLINTITAVLLIWGVVLIKQKKVELHQKVMTVAFATGGVFLLCYVAYHISNPATHFGGEGFVKYIYFFVLISHIVLSFVVLPFVLRAMFFALTKQFDRHQKVVKMAFPVWLYVSISGVISYLMISPYYQ